MPDATQYIGYIATSLDGFIADHEGSVAWLDPFNKAIADTGSDGGYGDFIGGVDALLMGRVTFEQVLGWGWPYEDRAGYVLTNRTGYKSEHATASGSIDVLHKAITKAGHKTVWVMGGGAAQRAVLDAGLFDSLRVFIMPTILGGGLPLFAPGQQHDLKLTSCQTLAGNILDVQYKIGD
jgi:dihydrofolate reductase